MAIYDYVCRVNGRTVEVRHGMSESVSTWGELCRRAGIDPGDTPSDAPVERKISAAIPLTGRAAGSGASAASCGCTPSSCGCSMN